MDSPGPLEIALVISRLADTAGFLDVGGAVEYFDRRSGFTGVIDSDYE